MRLETRFFGYTQNGNRDTVATGDLVRELGIAPIQEKKLLSLLARRGQIARVRRGLYLVPSQIPPGGKWTPSEALALNTLMADQKGRYQVSGPNAFSRYGWDEQIPTRVFVYNNKISGRRTIGAVQFTLAKVAEERLGATESVKTPEGIEMPYSTKPRAMMDAVYDWSRFNTLPRAFDWIRDELDRSGGFAADLVAVTLAYGNQGTLRRIGWILDASGAPQMLLRKIETALRQTSTFIPLVPTRPKRGKTNDRWMVVKNDG